MTQTELADALGTHQSVVARWETGATQPDFRTVTEVIAAAGFDLEVTITERNDQDLALIRRELSLAPSERLDSLVRAVRAFDKMAATARG